MTNARSHEEGTWYAKAIASVAAFDVVIMSQIPWGVAPAENSALRSPLLLGVLTCFALLGLYRFAKRPELLRWGSLALGSTICLEEILFHAYGVHEEPFYQPASAVFGWLLGVVIARGLAYYDEQPPSAGACRRAGLAGAAAIVGATYFNAGMSKLLAEGFAWGWDPSHVRLMTLAHQPLPPNGLDEIVIGWVGRSPAVGRFAACFTLVIELGGIVFALCRRLRPLAGLGIVAWHLGLLYSTGICFYGGFALIVCLGFRGVPSALDRWIAKSGVEVASAPRGRAALIGALPIATLLTAAVVALTGSTKRELASSVVVIVLSLVAIASFPWLKLRKAGGAVQEVAATNEAAELPAVQPRAAWMVGLAIMAVITGLYRLSGPPHTHDYSRLEGARPDGSTPNSSAPPPPRHPHGNN